jgi:hypothetical protein
LDILKGSPFLVSLHQLDQLDVERHAPVRQRRDRRLHPLDIAAVIGAEHVDQLVEAALHLVEVIGDVGGEIGPAAVGLLHRPVHVVADAR